MSLQIKLKRGTRAQINAAATAGQLIEGEPYLITDEARLALASSTTVYSGYVKQGEEGGSTQQTEYYITSLNNSPTTDVQKAMRINTSAYIYLEHHGIENVMGAYKVMLDVLLHGDHIYTSPSPGFRVQVALSYRLELTMYNDSSIGNIPRVTNIKIISYGGEYVRYSDQGGNNYQTSGLLREQDITFDTEIDNAQLLLKVTNNIKDNPNTDFTNNITLPVYGKYRVDMMQLYTSATTTGGVIEES